MIIRNAIKCKICGDIIESFSVHDYKVCSCGACAVDGGHEYLRRSAKSFDDIIELSEVVKNDLYFMCYMVERVARKLKQHNAYVVNTIGEAELRHLISVANVLHSVNPMQVEADWIADYHLQQGTFDITAVDKDLCEKIPAVTAMGKVYMRLILATLQPDEDYVQGMLRVYNNPICEVIDNYNASAYYEPSYVIARAYNDGGF